jgi:hypothetical protein
LPDALLERPQRLFGDLAFDHSARTRPEAVAQELATEHAGHRAFGLVDRQAQLAVEPPKQRHHPFTRPTAANVNVRIVGLAHEAMAPTFQRLVHFIEQDIGQQRREYSPNAKDNFEFELKICGWRGDAVLDLRRKR